MKNPLGNLMKQAQEMKAQMAQAQEELGALEVQGEAGGGMVRLTMSGRHEVKRIVIDDALVREDKDILEDILAAAFNDAVSKIAQTTQEKYSGMAGGLGLPAGLKLPF
ncbi:MAG: YbaB/EbfC family nucleoid-associated protein [Gammaproteobacteria bacterium]|nr:YbaB/EbfC family nucleoid-associated protein [Gammaproteobacteria bacterium]MCP4091164.1 YbaB/EbfC family nucleoid-associated protein [Gammaproteobacteria bacterium]MCP4277310.1 YbaB/EbfC family nucleoid-associated protein [Gammaproteobacteria bacterium]MCP4831629.1 YbaB/EbfC family nucleoid-associated protein [Gammaproteobacteria bacterium]MCP4927852.1 YbaB/EbfC family nucleoid-associated protein [Gammaproteobacteria bacterium]